MNFALVIGIVSCNFLAALQVQTLSEARDRLSPHSDLKQTPWDLSYKRAGGQKPDIGSALNKTRQVRAGRSNRLLRSASNNGNFHKLYRFKSSYKEIFSHTVESDTCVRVHFCRVGKGCSMMLKFNCHDPEGSATKVPPTHVPPSTIPPTKVPPTKEPPTDDPSTNEPPTNKPPTNKPPTALPPTNDPPTKQPPTNEPPTNDPPTKQPPTNEPPTNDPPTKQPPTNEPPTNDPSTNDPPTNIPPTGVSAMTPSVACMLGEVMSAVLCSGACAMIGFAYGFCTPEKTCQCVGKDVRE